MTGRPGIGVASTPAGNGISRVELNYADTTLPPTPAKPGVSAFSNSVEMQWQGSGDDATGSGLYVYQVYRRTLPSGAWERRGTTRVAAFTDQTVSPGTAYEYLLVTTDYHHNDSLYTIFPVTTAPAGTTNPRQIGLRTDGTYWGGAGEQIDTESGNVNFTLPIAGAQGRGGAGATFALRYNSQNWRKDPGGICSSCSTQSQSLVGGVISANNTVIFGFWVQESVQRVAWEVGSVAPILTNV